MTRWIRTPDDLQAFAGSLEGCRALALDSESDSLYHHFEKVCLVQIATDRGDACLVDPLALSDLSPLAPVPRGPWPRGSSSPGSDPERVNATDHREAPP